MKIVVFDINPERAEKLVAQLDKHYDAETFIYLDKGALLKQMQYDPVDVVFMMLYEECFDVITKIRDMSPLTNIIVISNNKDYILKAMKLRISGFVLYPYTWADICEELCNLRYPMDPAGHKLFFKTFGTFDIFFDHQPVALDYIKSRELLAYLFYREGASCTIGEIKSALWEDDGHTDYLRQLKSDIVHSLEKLGFHNAIQSRRGLMGLNMACVTSDYQDYMEGKPGAKDLYQGEFMAQYDWAEEKNTILRRKLH